jgi:SAM-dependent methyltransferase
MNIQLITARFLLNLGKFFQSLPVVVMKPDNLIAFSRQTYANPANVESWAEDNLVDSGLTKDEQAFVQALPMKKGKLLLLGVGGGREAIPLSQMGFQVTGVDFVEAMVDRAQQNAIKRGESIEGLVQEISQLALPPDTYDVVWMSRAMYPSVPTRKRRVAMLHRIATALKPDGYLICQYHQDPQYTLSKKAVFIRRLIATFTFGNRDFEPGDILWFNIEFAHAFASEDEVQSELAAGGFDVIRFHSDQYKTRVGVICKKKSQSKQNYL